jgi:hypothetical protein
MGEDAACDDEIFDQRGVDRPGGGKLRVRHWVPFNSSGSRSPDLPFSKRLALPGDINGWRNEATFP